MSKLADEIRDNTEIVCGIAQQLEALARVLTHVETGSDGEESNITLEDFVSIMQVFQEKLDSLKDLAGGIGGAVEYDGKPSPMAAV